MIEIYNEKQQVYGEFNGGEIIENKPIGFPSEKGGTKAYSNLFYWAHAKANIDSTIGLHPHKGFEIMSYVINGSIKHYDTLIKKWKILNKGDVQIIQSGSGISHSEAINKDSSIFQIWFDPNLEKSIFQKPKYKDYSSKKFKSNSSKKIIIGNNSPVKINSEKIEIFELKLEENYIIESNLDQIISIYVLEGKLEICNNKLNKHDFLKIQKMNKIEIKIKEKTKLFCISSPKKTSYKTYIN